MIVFFFQDIHVRRQAVRVVRKPDKLLFYFNFFLEFQSRNEERFQKSIVGLRDERDYPKDRPHI